MQKIILIVAVMIALQGACAGTLAAQQADPQEPVQGVPDNLRKPLATFLEATGWKNGEKLASVTKYWPILDHIFLLRVVDKFTCDEEMDLCLTILGGLRNGGFVSEAVFYAGGKVQLPDNTMTIGGADGPTLFFVRFVGKKQIVIAAPAPTGWIIIPGPIELPKN